MSTISREYFAKLSEKIYSARGPKDYMALELFAEDSQFIRFNHAKVRQLGNVGDAFVSLRYIVESAAGLHQNSIGFSLSGNWDLDYERARQAIMKVRAECASLPVDSYAELPSQIQRSEMVIHGNVLDRKLAPETILAQASGLDFTGLYSAGDIIRGYSDSLGQSHWFKTTNFILNYSLYGEGERSYKGFFSRGNWSDSDFHQEIAEARQKLEATKNPVRQVPRGPYRTYLAPAAVADLVGFLSYGGASEMALRQGDSPLRLLREGKKSMSPLFSLTEDYTSGNTPRFNDRGELAPEILPIIQNGKLANTLISRRTAKEYSLQENGAAQSELLRAPVIAAGQLAEADVLRNLREGLYISNIHYLNWSDQQHGRVTGMTRFACLWVENGKFHSPIQNLRWDDSLFTLFGSELEAVTNRVLTFPDSSSYEFRSVGAVRCPGILVKNMQFTL